ncbi:MAG: Release factor glutamine methyltransferase [Planctomycetota bacterium]
MVPHLAEREVDSPRAVAEILLSSVLGVERLKLYMEPERELSADELAKLRALVTRAGRHEPVQYLVGRWPFFGRDFEVGPSTLIPRPCTEVLVERALGWIRERTAEKPEASLDVLDLCTGTGCIAISLALGMRAIRRPDGTGCRPIRAAAGTLDQAAQLHATQQPVAVPVVRDLASEGRVRATESALSDVVGAERETTATTTRTTTTNAAAHDLATGGATGGATGVATVVATDIVSDAIELARRNAARLAAHIDLRVGDLYGALRDEEGFDLIVSNPPYVTDAEYSELDRNVREYEPASALRGGADGLQFVRAVVAGAERRLRSGGLLLVEIGWKHGDAVRKLGTRAGWRDVEVLRDGDGHERVLVAHRV